MASTNRTPAATPCGVNSRSVPASASPVSAGLSARQGGTAQRKLDKLRELADDPAGYDGLNQGGLIVVPGEQTERVVEIIGTQPLQHARPTFHRLSLAAGVGVGDLFATHVGSQNRCGAQSNTLHHTHNTRPRKARDAPRSGAATPPRGDPLRPHCHLAVTPARVHLAAKDSYC